MAIARQRLAADNIVPFVPRKLLKIQHPQLIAAKKGKGKGKSKGRG
jgi:hypothetical protein